MPDYPVGTKLLHVESGIEGVVVVNFKLLGDVCVDWKNGFSTSYDAEILNASCEIINEVEE